MYEVRNSHLQITANEGCSWLVQPAMTVTLTGYLDGLGYLMEMPELNSVILEMEIESAGYDRDTGESTVVTWTFSDSTILKTLSLLAEAVMAVRSEDQRQGI